VDGTTTAVYVGAAVVALGAVAAFAMPRERRPQVGEVGTPVTQPVLEAEAA
jgi:energy-converting hydrogenase Eha subunit E